MKAIAPGTRSSMNAKSSPPKSGASMRTKRSPPGSGPATCRRRVWGFRNKIKLENFYRLAEFGLLMAL